MSEISITLPEPHADQIRLLKQRRRFTVVRCGRRWGKTLLAAVLLIAASIDGKKAGYFTPKYKTLEEVWRLIITLIEPLIKYKNTGLKRIELITGGVIEFWSLTEVDAPRGRDYDEIIVDEAAFIEELKDTFQKILRPMLLDRRGSAWFLSSPNGYNDFYELSKMWEQHKGWASFHAPAQNNPYLSKAELREIKAETDPDIYAQEYEADFVSFNGKNFIKHFSRDKNVTSLQFDKQLPVYFSFDFNITSTALIIQRPDEYTTHVLGEIHTEGYEIENLCSELALNYPGSWRINGDASGNARSALSPSTAYDIIKNSLNIEWEQFNTMTSNPTHLDSFIFCNYIFKNHTVLIDESCEGLINDIERVKVIQEKKFEIDKKDQRLTHYLDAGRYHWHAECWQVVKQIDK
jgi:hypothetical protein